MEDDAPASMNALVGKAGKVIVVNDYK